MRKKLSVYAKFSLHHKEVHLAQYLVNYLGNLRTQTKHLDSGNLLLTDAPKDNHGLGETFSPTDLLAVSLATCMMTLMGICARGLGVDLTDATMSVEKTMVQNPRRIGKISIHFSSKSAPDDKQKSMLEKAALECPVHKSLHPDMIIDTTFTWNETL